MGLSFAVSSLSFSVAIDKQKGGQYQRVRLARFLIILPPNSFPANSRPHSYQTSIAQICSLVKVNRRISKHILVELSLLGTQDAMATETPFLINCFPVSRSSYHIFHSLFSFNVSGPMGLSFPVPCFLVQGRILRTLTLSFLFCALATLQVRSIVREIQT